jgi:hypothetical protein
MNDKVTISCGNFGFCSVMFLIFMTLKLTGTITWSWFWVTAPLWIPIALVCLVLTAMLGLWLLTMLFVSLFDR